jgi:hypothetical protein
MHPLSVAGDTLEEKQNVDICTAARTIFCPECDIDNKQDEDEEILAYRTHHRIHSGYPSQPLPPQRIQPPNLSCRRTGLPCPLSYNNTR